MSEYVRTTRECFVSQLHPELFQAIQKYFQEHQLGNLQAETLLCCETVSKKKFAGKTGSWLNSKSDITIYTGILLTSQWLVWAHHGDQSGTLLNAADLKQIRAKFYTSSFTKDSGLEIVGYIGDVKGRVRGYIGMGADLAAQKFCEEVRQAINKVNPPTQNGLFKWLTG
ncbi:MAG TPA: hypothetical protein V6C95_14520 [Coleofasciculaceae cyanobacterium]